MVTALTVDGADGNPGWPGSRNCTPNVTSPTSLKMVGTLMVVLPTVSLTLVMTSESTVDPMSSGLAPDAPWRLTMRSCDGDRLSRTTSPQLAESSPAATSAAADTRVHVVEVTVICYSLEIFGVMKISSSRLASESSSRLNSQPRSGSRYSPGVRSWCTCSRLM